MERRRLLAFSAAVNFQPAGVAVPAGTVADVGAVFASRGNGLTYGWDESISSAMRDRNNSASPDQRYDTLVHTQLYGVRKWEIEVPNGAYSVRVVAGDPSYTDSIYRYNAEGVLAVSGTPTSSQRWFDNTISVNVSDGRLTITNAADAKNNKLAFVEVKQIEAGNQAPSVMLSSPINGTQYSDGATIGLSASATDPDGYISAVDFYSNGVNLGSDNSAPYAMTLSNVATGTYTFTAVARDNQGAATTSTAVKVTVGSTPAGNSKPYHSNASTAPGTIEAENFDEGGEGVAYHDTTAGNSGQSYRSGNVDVGSATEGGYYVGAIRPGEWLKYTVDVTQPELSWTLDAKVASTSGGTFHVEFDGVNRTGAMTIPNTGGAQTWRLISKSGIGLAQGRHVMRIVFDTIASGESIGNVNWFRLSQTPGTGTWSAGAPSPIRRFEASNATVGGKLYVLGGFDPSIDPNKRCDVYDPATDTWKRLADMPEAVTHAGTVVVGTKIYLVGGFVQHADEVVTNHVWIYDTASNTWSVGKSLPASRAAGGAGLVGSALHFFGGTNGGQTIDYADHWTLDLSNPYANWLPASALPNPRNHMGYATIGTKLYAIGGQHLGDEAHGNQSEVDVYDTAAGAWTPATSLPFPRSHNHTDTVVLNDKIFVAGGQANTTGDSPRTVADVNVFNPTTGEWSSLPPLPQGRQAAAGQVINGQYIVTTGTPTGIDPRTDTFKLDLRAYS